MIVPEKDNKAAEAKAELAESSIFDPPPTYVSTSSAPPAIAPTYVSPRSLAPKSKPTNYLLLDRANHPIKGVYTIDPFMSIPRSLLPSLAAGETESGRKNLKMLSKNGSVDVDITLLADLGKQGTAEADRKRHTTLDIGSHNGSINVKLRRIDATSSGIPIPFHLNVTGHNGSVTIGVPRTFEGLLTIHAKNGSVKISDEITERITMQNEENYTHRYFVGDISSFNSQDADWTGDKLDVDAHNGRVKVHFTDEADLEIGKSKSGLLSRILGLS